MCADFIAMPPLPSLRFFGAGREVVGCRMLFG